MGFRITGYRLRNLGMTKFWNTSVLTVFLICTVISCVSGSEFEITQWTNGNGVTDIIPVDGGFWAVTTGGLVLWDTGTHQYRKYTTLDGVNDNWCLTGTRDLTGTLYFGTLLGGISVLDGTSWDTITVDDGLPYNEISGSAVDYRNRTWFAFGGAFGHGIGIKNGDDWKFLSKSDGLNHNYVTVILPDNGGAWIGSNLGINRIDDDAVAAGFTSADGLVHDKVKDIARGAGADLWIATEGGVSRFDGVEFQNYTTNQGLPSDAVQAIAVDSNGRVWAGTDNGLCYFQDEAWVPAAFHSVINSGDIRNLTITGPAQLLCGVYNDGVYLIQGNQVLDEFRTPDQLPDNHVRCMTLDGDTIWFGCAGGQVGTITGETWTVYTPQDGMTPGWIRDIGIDSLGNKWVGTFGNGVFRFDGTHWVQFNTENGLSNNNVMNIFIDEDDSIWVSTFGGGISRYDGSNWTVIDESDGLANNRVYRIAKEKTGKYWICQDDGVTLYDGETMENYYESDGLVFHRVYEVEIDEKNIKWFGACKGLSRFDGQTFTNYYEADGLAHYRVRDMIFDRYGMMWLATGGGVNYFNGSTFESLLPSDGIAGYETYMILLDSQNRFWTCSEGGITRIEVNKMDNAVPGILAGGWRYQSAGSSGQITWQAVPSDGDHDNLTVELTYAGTPLGLLLNDEGIDGDVKTGDGIYTLTVPVDGSVPSGQYRIGMQVRDVRGGSGIWPALTVR